MTTEPVGLSQDLTAQRVMRAQVGEHDLAIWRSASSNVQAWANRCPHRGMRLSHGFVRGESLACAYHGWHYNCEGTCHYIPAHPELEPPKTIKPVAFSVVEQQGVLWVNTASEAKPPSLPENLSSVRTMAFDCSIASAVAAYKTAEPTDHSYMGVSLSDLSVTDYTDTPTILAIGLNDKPETGLLLFQQTSPTSINVHILADKSLTSDIRIALSRWSESVRRAAEGAS